MFEYLTSGSFDAPCDKKSYSTSFELGQVSSLTSSLEVERSLDLCTLAVHRPLAYFISALVKTFCKCAKSIIKVHVPEH